VEFLINRFFGGWIICSVYIEGQLKGMGEVTDEEEDVSSY
jgi:hypothetical protein